MQVETHSKRISRFRTPSRRLVLVISVLAVSPFANSYFHFSYLLFPPSVIYVFHTCIFSRPEGLTMSHLTNTDFPRSTALNVEVISHRLQLLNSKSASGVISRQRTFINLNADGNIHYRWHMWPSFKVVRLGRVGNRSTADFQAVQRKH